MATKTKITVTVDADLLQSLEQYNHQSRSELVETAMKLYRKHLIGQKLLRFYAQHQETPQEQDWADIASDNLDAAFADD
jgi:metal-responsive CopG/Arc/MetJ family transcriptional regulator